MSVNVKRIREVFEDNDEVASWCDTSTYVGAETYTHLVGLYETALAAADEIDLLRAENERLREALKECEEELDAYYHQEYPTDHPYHQRKLKAALQGNPARAALKENS